ncbi:hypothetical protein [Kineococcus rubinsiae]|uniref:hypothetical protein n=1 Tax=Kineococcus rubinsiae TaxID=2609562 RepID=UPI00143228A8|nr:hypothetical protein [Kineococcus rubinsiae]NIZ93302.1 hypothetical protein [Kineococcus rubinsiae]
MSGSLAPGTALLAGAALHAGFQAVVTFVVYPALADAGRASPSTWAVVHAAHSRRVGAVVAPVYLVVLGTWAWVFASLPLTPALVVSGVGSAVAGLTTAAVAAPTHTRLGRDGPAPALLTRLLVADRVRCAGAVLALAAAAVAG